MTSQSYIGLHYPTLYYPNIQLSNLKLTLRTLFKPDILGFLLSDLLLSLEGGIIEVLLYFLCSLFEVLL